MTDAPPPAEPPPEPAIQPPPRPDPWRTTQPREAMRDTDHARIVSLAPSVNLTPIGGAMVPIPYNLVDIAGHDGSYTPTVRFTGQKAMTMKSFTEHVHGDEAGTGGGAKSGTHGGICEPIEHAAMVRSEGSPVIRHLDQCWMNNRNTVGETQFVRDTAAYSPAKDTDPIPGSARTILDHPSSQVVSDANPDPSLFTPGARLAFNDTQARFSSPPVAAPPPAAPSVKPPLAPPDPAKPPNGTGLGLWRKLMILLGMGEAGHELGDMAGREYVGPDGVRGRQLTDALTSNAPPAFSPQGFEIGKQLGETGKGPITGTNGLLSLKAGRPLDFRTMSPAETDALLRQPWPSAEQLKQNRESLKAERDKLKPAEDPKPAVTDGGGGNARITGEERRERCKVGPYRLMKNACGAGTQAHHIIPDYTLRYGNRGEAERNAKRVGDLGEAQNTGHYPTFNEGMCICLQGNAKIPADSDLAPDDPEREHQAAHSGDLRIAALGRSGTPVGTVTIGTVIKESREAVLTVREDCGPEIDAAIEAEFHGVDRNQLARSTPALPEGQARTALIAGKLQGYKP